MSELRRLCFPDAFNLSQIFGNSIFEAGENVSEIVLTLQMALQACPLKFSFHFVLYCLQYSGNILDHFRNTCSGLYANCVFRDQVSISASLQPPCLYTEIFTLQDPSERLQETQTFPGRANKIHAVRLHNIGSYKT